MSWVGDGAPQIVLASGSPRRLDLLRSIGIEPLVVVPSVDEQARPGERPAELVERLARAKARAVADDRGGVGRGSAGEPGPDRWPVVVGADTVIDLDGRVLGKPTDRGDAQAMLSALRGRDHHVLTGVAIVAPRPDGRPVVTSSVARTTVTMRAFDDDELAWYLDSGEYRDKAGAYAIQGLGSLLVEGITGSYQNVVGLPLTTVDRLLGDAGHSLRDLRSPVPA